LHGGEGVLGTVGARRYRVKIRVVSNMKFRLATAMILAGLNCPAAKICATVSDEMGQPLAGARLQASAISDGGAQWLARTDRSGRACLTVPPGLIALEASLPGFLNVRYFPVRAQIDRSPDFRIALPVGEVTEGPITGEAVIIGALGMKGAGVQVCLRDSAGKVDVKCTVADEFGEYLLSVKPGIYFLAARANGAVLEEKRVDLRGGGYFRNLLSPR
jgi:hypothetical protein